MYKDWGNLPDGYSIACEAFAAGVRPPPDWTVSEWADDSRRLPVETSKEEGRWHTDRVPLAREIMDALSPRHPAHRIIFMASRQVSKTEIGLNWAGHHGDMCKGSMMCTQPSLEPLAERFSKTRLGPMIQECASLRAKFGMKSRDGNNTIFLKHGPGVILAVSGANSAASLRQLPFKKLFCDEIDAYELDIENEGDPISILEGAMTTFPDRKVYLCSSPTVRSLSRINKEYERSDRRQYHVPCPHCHAAGRADHGLQVLVWEQLGWPDGHPEQAQYLCIHCGNWIDESFKAWMLAEAGHGGFAKWIAQNPERTALGVLGYHANGLYASPGLGLTWGELAQQWERVKNDPVERKSFINVRLGLCFDDTEDRLDHDELMRRVSGYAARTVPPGCLFITGGVDVQKDRFALAKIGHGRNRTLYILDYVEIPADPTLETEWLKVENYMREPLYNDRGREMRVSAYGVDSGYLTDDVLRYTSARRGLCIAVKGASVPGKPIIASKPGKTEFSWPKGSTLKYGAEVWTVGGDTFNDWFYLRLQNDRKRPLSERLVHFPGRLHPSNPEIIENGLDEPFYLQITAEVFDPNKQRWVKLRANEALDCIRYAVAAALQPQWQVHKWSEAKWRGLEEKFWPPVDLFTAAGLFPDPPPAQSAAPVPAAPTAPPEQPKNQPLSLADVLRQRLGK